MQLTVIKTEEGLDSLEESWKQLEEKIGASYFSSFDFVRLSWRHFHNSTDRLLVLSVWDGAVLIGIGPFFITNENRKGIPCRIVKFISAWQGDRPEILADGNKALVWNEILVFFHNFRQWDILEISEQRIEGPTSNGWDLVFHRSIYWEFVDDAVSYYVPLSDGFDDYLKSLPGKVKSSYRRATRQLSERTDQFKIECISDSEQVIKGLDRFISIESRGWKGDAGISISNRKSLTHFYRDVVRQLATTGGVQIFFLVADGEDIAATFNFVYHNIVYGVRSAYDPSYRQCSPGTIVLVGMLEHLFSKNYRELDMLGMCEDTNPQPYKARWGKGQRKSVQLVGYRILSRVFPLILAKKLKSIYRCYSNSSYHQNMRASSSHYKK